MRTNRPRLRINILIDNHHHPDRIRATERIHIKRDILLSKLIEPPVSQTPRNTRTLSRKHVKIIRHTHPHQTLPPYSLHLLCNSRIQTKRLYAIHIIPAPRINPIRHRDLMPFLDRSKIHRRTQIPLRAHHSLQPTARLQRQERIIDHRSLAHTAQDFVNPPVTPRAGKQVDAQLHLRNRSQPRIRLLAHQSTETRSPHLRAIASQHHTIQQVLPLAKTPPARTGRHQHESTSKRQKNKYISVNPRHRATNPPVPHRPRY